MGMAAILAMWPRLFEQTVVPLYQGGPTWNLALIGQTMIAGKKFENIESEWLGPRSMNDLDLWYS